MDVDDIAEQSENPSINGSKRTGIDNDAFCINENNATDMDVDLPNGGYVNNGAYIENEKDDPTSKMMKQVARKLEEVVKANENNGRE